MSNENNKDSVAVTLPSGEAGNAVDVLELRSGETFSLSDVTAAYLETSTAAATLELYDESVGTTAGNASDLLDHYRLESGGGSSARIELTDIDRKEVEDGIVAVLDAGQDADIILTVGGETVTY